MEVSKKPKNVQFMCTYCGKIITKRIDFGRPLPGQCPRRNGKLPHRWVINKKF